MQSSSTPTKISTPFADGGTKNTIPVDSQISITPGAASFETGFPPLTMTPIAAGGIPPKGADVNGILYAITAIQQWQCAGGMPKYDAAFATAIFGYPKGAVVLKANESGWWISTAENNVSDPDGASPTGWKDAFKVILDMIQQATTTVSGLVELATAAETAAGTDGTRAVTPAGLKQSLDAKQNLASNLTAFAGLSGAADKLPYFTGAGVLSLAVLTEAARALIAAENAAGQRAAMGLGSAATKNTGTSGANVPMMNADNTWSGDQVLDNGTEDSPAFGYRVPGLVLREDLIIDSGTGHTIFRSWWNDGSASEVLWYHDINAATSKLFGFDVYTKANVSSFIQTLLDDADAASARGTLGAISSADVPYVIAGLGVGTVGTYSFCRNLSGVGLNPGDTIAGSNLRYAWDDGMSEISPTGTWRCMGAVDYDSITIFLRIA